MTSGDGRFHNLGYFTNLNQIRPLFSVETPRLKYSFTQLAVSVAAALPDEQTGVLFPAGARDLFLWGHLFSGYRAPCGATCSVGTGQLVLR